MALSGVLGGSMLIPSSRHASSSNTAPTTVSRATTGQTAVRLSASDKRFQSSSVTPLKSRSQVIQQPPPRQGPMRSQTSSSLLHSGLTNGAITPMTSMTSASRPYTPMPSRPVASFTPLSPKGGASSYASTTFSQSRGTTITTSGRPATTSAVVTPAAVAASAASMTPLLTPKSLVAPASVTSGSFVAPISSAAPPQASMSVPIFASKTAPAPEQVKATTLSAALGSAVAVPTTAYLPTSGGSFTVPAGNGGGSMTAPFAVAANGGGSMAVPAGQQTMLMSATSPVTAAPAPAVASDPSQHQMLQAGTQVQIQGNLYCVTEPLGMGSFGAVWAAERVDGLPGEVAIKEIACGSQKELGDAALEGKLLRMIHSSKPQVLVDKAPDLVGTEVVPLGQDQWVMRLAMTKVPGIQLDSFLEMLFKPNSNASNAALATAIAVVAAQSQTLAGVCAFARDMLSQLAFIFECMSPIVYHRDVSPHNILIDTMNSNGFQFGLVDFGLGSDLQSWHGPQGPGSWHHADIGGDCRYWPVSVWVMFVSGAEELTKASTLGQEYQTRLDFHAVGITVLEVVMTLLPQSALAREEIRALQVAWNQYWQDVTRFWKRTMEVFDSGQDPTALKLWIRGGGRVTEILGADLAALRGALRRAAQACRTSCPDAAQLFTTLLELVSNAGLAGVSDGLQSPSWQRIRRLIDDDVPVPSSGSLMVAPGPMAAPNYGGSMQVSVGPVGRTTSYVGGSALVPAATPKVSTPKASTQAVSIMAPGRSPMLSPQAGSTMLPIGFSPQGGSAMLPVGLSPQMGSAMVPTGSTRARSPVSMPSRSPLVYTSPTRMVRA